jgi:purine-nucleoside phosphorylase
MEAYRRQVEECSKFLLQQMNLKPEWGIILGTGQGRLAEHLSDGGACAYRMLPNFPAPTSPSHAGQLCWGNLAGQPVLIFQGRCHAYEGYSLRQVTFPVRVMAAVGVKTLLVTNAAGGLNPLFRAGDLMVISDHLNLMGDNPLVGENLEEWGLRFPDLSQVYDRRLRELAEEVGRRQGLTLRQGVYVGLKGPSLETPAETRFLRLIGADAVGMSTIPEVITAVHAGLRVFGVSVISNVNLPDAMAPIALEEIIANVARAETQLIRLLLGIIELDRTAP